MGKHTSVFQTSEDYNAAVNQRQLAIPNVSYIKKAHKVKFNKTNLETETNPNK